MHESRGPAVFRDRARGGECYSRFTVLHVGGGTLAWRGPGRWPKLIGQSAPRAPPSARAPTLVFSSLRRTATLSTQFRWKSELFLLPRGLSVTRLETLRSESF